MFSSITENAKDSLERTSDCTDAQIQELNDVREFFKIQRSKYNKCKILYDAIQDCICHSASLDGDLKTKVQDIVLANDCAQVLDLDSDGFSKNSQTLLGLAHLDAQELNYIESLKLKKAVQLTLQNKYKILYERFMAITGKDINLDLTAEDNGDFNLRSEDQILLTLKTKVDEQHKKYLANLLEEKTALEDIIKLRLDKLPQVCKDKLDECQLKSRVCELQCKIVQEKARVDIFMESNNSLMAYKELIKDIKYQQEECQQDIQYLRKLKNQYQQIACKQYDDILKSFIQYKSALEKKKMLYESLY